jgi:transposase
MKQGGDRRSQHIEAEAAFILVEEKPDLTLSEIQTRLKERGKRAGIGTLWRFFQRHGITLKKRLRTPPSRTERM